ncbi:MAG TPA: hypothetical protein VHT92_09050 [Candidatus Cybelea sp.]|nr:hypothetical protein [Candidatus Cybelea sp.]
MHAFHKIAATLAALTAAAGCNAERLGSVAPAVPSGALNRHVGGAGSLDPSFGSGGTVVIPLDAGPVTALATPDRRIVILGNTGSGGSAKVIRLLRDGKLDRSFGSGGSVSLQLYAAYHVAAAPDGKFIVGGIASDGFHAELIRLTADGRLDSTFGSNGAIVFEYLSGQSNGVLVTLVQPDGKIVAGGFAENPTTDVEQTSLARFDSSGNLDSSFGTGGIVSLKLVGAVTAMGFQSDGDILVCGGRFDSSSSLMARFLPDGTLDGNDRGGSLTSVAHTGSLTFEGSNEFDARGRLLQWSSASTSSKQYVRVDRLLRNQRRDRHFVDKAFAFDSPSANVPEDVEIASDGTLLVAGEGSENGLSEIVFGIARLLAGGRLDPSFGDRGRVVTAFGEDARATALTIQSDGKIVAAGVTHATGSSSEVAVARYLAQ